MTEWINLIGLFTAPVIAVLITLWWDNRRRKRDQKETVLQNFLTGWGRPADPVYTFAIRQIPIVFAKNKKVVEAFKEWFKTTNLTEDRDMNDSEVEIMNKKQRLLLNEILRDLGFRNLTADDISDYTSRGLAERDMLLSSALKALPAIAVSADVSARSAYELAKLQTGENFLNHHRSEGTPSK